MKKELFLRSMLGFPIGVAIGYLITIFISLIWANGHYLPCVPELTALVGSEIHAVLLQALLCGILGIVYAAGSIIWKIENWGLMKQTGIYFVIISVIMMPAAYAMYWMEHSVKGFFSYLGTYAFIFIVIWLAEYAMIKHKVKKLNETLYKKQHDKIK